MPRAKSGGAVNYPDGSVTTGMYLRDVGAGALGHELVRRATLTVGTAVVTATPATLPTGVEEWAYLKVSNLHATNVLSVAINQDPSVSAADPPGAAQWGVGYDIPGGQTEMIPLTGTITTIRLKADAATTPVILNLVA